MNGRICLVTDIIDAIIYLYQLKIPASPRVINVAITTYIFARGNFLAFKGIKFLLPLQLYDDSSVSRAVKLAEVYPLPCAKRHSSILDKYPFATADER